MSDFSELELRELNVELQQVDEGFETLNEIFGAQGFDLPEESSEELSALNAELEGTELFQGEIGEQAFLEQGIFGRVWKAIAKRVIKPLVRLVNKFRKLKPCVPAVISAVKAFNRGSYKTAAKRGYSAAKCIRAHL